MSADIKVIGNDSKLDRILNREYVAKRSHYIEVGPGKMVLPGKFEKFYERIENFEVRDDDVFVLAFPKTGSRWTQEMVWLLLNNLDYKTAREVTLHDRSPLLELETLLDEFPTNVDYFKKVLETKSPRSLGSHLQWSLLPKSIRNYTKQPKIIIVLRAPEDCCVSYYNQAKVLEGYTGNWDEFCDLFLGGKVPLGPFWEHTLGLWEQRHMPNIKFVKYSKMISDLAGTIRDMAEFLGKHLSDDDVKEMCQHLSFDNLKKSPGFNNEHYITLKKGELSPFLRKGTVGDHQNLMSLETIDAFKKQTEEYLRGTGLTFD